MKIKTILYPLSLVLTMSACGPKNQQESQNDAPLDTVFVAGRQDFASSKHERTIRIRAIDTQGNTHWFHNCSKVSRLNNAMDENAFKPAEKTVESVTPGDTVVFSDGEFVENLSMKRKINAWNTKYR